ncbi:uncharacterized protein [Choristoneura fumiferana]|uniref:uncharacterized protein n=1 Tax=Choristoneura fumiferana TaxID=7141 RepID=UPI003D15B217
MASLVSFLVCWFIVAISGYDSFDDGYNNDIGGLSYTLSGGNIKLSDVRTLSDQDSKHQLLNEVIFAQALSKGFTKLRAIVTAGTKYAKKSDDYNSLKEDTRNHPDTSGGRKKKLCMFTMKKEYCMHQEKSLK